MKILDYFGSRAKLARALNITRGAVSLMQVRGISPQMALRIERLSCGDIKATEIVLKKLGEV